MKLFFSFFVLFIIRMDDPIADFIQWYKSRPLITKTFITLSTIQAILLTMGYANIHWVYYTFSMTYPSLQIWRPLTSLLFLGYLNFHFIVEAYFAYHVLVCAQKDIFPKKQIGNFWYLLIYLFVMMVLVASFIDLYFISAGFLFALVNIWCKYKPFNRVNLMLGLNMESGYFPWVYLGVNVLLGQSFINLIAGYVIARLYLFIRGSLYEKTGIDFLKTPSILHSLANIYNRWSNVVQQQDEYNIRNENQMEENDDMYE